MTDTVLTATQAEAQGFVVDRTCYPWFAYKGARFAPDDTVEIITEAHIPRGAAFEVTLPSPVHHEDNPLCTCIAAYLERDLIDPQCPLDVAVEAVENATGLQERDGAWRPSGGPATAHQIPRHTKALLAGDHSARITFRPAGTDMVASDLWGADEMPEHPTAADVVALAASLGRDDAVRLWALCEKVTVTVSGPEVGDFSSAEL